MGCCCGNKSKTGNGAATLFAPPSGNPPVAAQYPQQAGVCSSGAVVPQAPFLTSPGDYSSLPPIASVPVIQRLGRRYPNNRYVFSPNPPGVVQVQSPKVGRY